jgi:hypothetical protein
VSLHASVTDAGALRHEACREGMSRPVCYKCP